jgi:hypothetical protein
LHHQNDKALEIMRVIFDKIKINRITFESSSELVQVDCVISQGNALVNSILDLNHSDLNRLINRMNQLNIDIDYSECFEVVTLPQGNNLFTLNVSEFAQEAELIDLYFDHVVAQKIA